MRKLYFFLLCIIAVLFMMLAVSSASAESKYPSSYAEDHVQIEDLVNRYMYAIDFNDAEAMASMFTEDSTLHIGKNQLVGRAAIINSAKERAEAAKNTSDIRPPVHRHFVSNFVLQVDGDKAVGKAYCLIGNVTPDRKLDDIMYGFYDDEFVKVNGQWFFKFRKFYTE